MSRSDCLFLGTIWSFGLAFSLIAIVFGSRGPLRTPTHDRLMWGVVALTVTGIILNGAWEMTG